ncbi:tellurium resistance protein [Massilia forsythiae]|uniref:Tellurium resistance protein n=1 Tax=Massilia forsythiae TaxID=2728020 RepID=A0A7Z2VZN6_9BURK|nr:TerD family protein [Massilia forsythiae]QJE01837.1 tellurium resistance protein [Massilia forsythiae]
MQTFTRGQKGKLSDLGLPLRLPVAVELQAAGHAPAHAVDISCFGLDAGERLADDRYMVFYNQLASARNEVSLALAPGRADFQVDLEALPPSIAKLVFTAAIDGGAAIRSAGPITLRLGHALAFTLDGADLAAEKAVILAELYRRDGQWRFGAVGQGFDGGLSALLAHFGGEEARPSVPAPAPVPASAPVAPAAAASTAPAAPKVSLSKITLDKRGDKVSLDKRGNAGFGRIRVNLDWNQASRTPARGLLDRLRNAGARGVDLDLGCLYELADGSRGVVQALGNSWGSFDGRPFIRLEGDDRTGAVQGGENMLVNGDRFDQIRRVLVFAYIYRGVANWVETDGVVTVTLPDQPAVEVRLDHGSAYKMCAIAMIDNDRGQLRVTKLAEYVADHVALDQRYGFGLRWKTGSKN